MASHCIYNEVRQLLLLPAQMVPHQFRTRDVTRINAWERMVH